MEYIQLGQTGLKVSRIGIGTEHLNRCSQKRINEVISCAVDRGYTYFDILTAKDEARDKFGKAFAGKRDQMVIAGHLVRAERDPSKALVVFGNLLRSLGTDHVDVLFIQWIDKQVEYDDMMRPEGLYALAGKLKQEGKARAIGMSCHRPETALLAARSEDFDVLMHPVNLASKAICSPFRRGFVAAEKKAVLNACVEHGLPVIAMKVFWGGRLLAPGCGVQASPVQCLQYTLKQPGVEAALGGVSRVEEVEDLDRFWSASDEDKDFLQLIADQEAMEAVVEGCVYCNHCLPCPQGIDIAEVNRIGDIAALRVTPRLRSQYDGLEAKASDCSECGACTEKCPFGVDVIDKMRKTRELMIESLIEER
jgi:predicted aldo/keto reductase-like oxidoreductase